jgi:hypothetical protein
MKNIFFNAQHSPIGAFSSLTLGYKGKSGGLGLELGGPANQNFYVGLQLHDDLYEALPFFDIAEDETKRYDIENSEESSDIDNGTIRIIPFQDSDISRTYKLTSDSFSAKDLTFTIHSQVSPLPDPSKTSDDALKDAVIPSLWLELTIDNSNSSVSRRAFIGYTGTDPYSALRHIDGSEIGEPALRGIGQGNITAITTLDPSVSSATAFTMEMILAQELEENWKSYLGNTCALIMDVPAHEIKTYKFAASFFRSGIATSGLSTSYYYTMYFCTIEVVSLHALKHYDQFVNACYEGNNLLKNSHLNDDQNFMLIHAIRSYYGSTQFMIHNKQALWIVNEGEYRMMNTFDLTVDQLFFEMKMNPWTVKNELDLFTSRYSYHDTVNFPGDSKQYPGGISFTHDMGVTNVFSRPGFSSYERHGLTDCFSHMTHEQLVNWICCAAVYIEGNKDYTWRDKNLSILEACFDSMLNRDHPDPSKRTGIMKLDSSRVMGGAEITTYDSLDISLGQARNNIYLASKCWAAYVALEKIFIDTDMKELSKEAAAQAERCAKTIADNMTDEGYIPAVINENNTSKIIPAIEGLVFPYFTGCNEALNPSGKYADFLSTLTKHFTNVLTPGICLFADGGWKLSSTSNNSWLSKIYLCQFIAHKLLDIPRDQASKKADSAHVNWLLHPEESYFAWSDQMLSGEAKGSKYYPRGVTSILWLLE